MAHPCFSSPWILNSINISNANYPPTISLLSFRHTRLWKCVFSELQDCGWWAEFQLCKGHLSICSVIAERLICTVPKSPQKLSLADKKHTSFSRRTSCWRPRWAKAPHSSPWTSIWMLPIIFPKDCLAFRLTYLKTKSLKHGVDPCADVGMCRLT